MNQNLLQLREAILAVAEAHAELAVAYATDADTDSRDGAYCQLHSATHQLDEALEFLGGE